METPEAHLDRRFELRRVVHISNGRASALGEEGVLRRRFQPNRLGEGAVDGGQAGGELVEDVKVALTLGLVREARLLEERRRD